MSVVQDLPDPLEKPAAMAASQSPDDLLSQMADDAIDKLIAEADAHSAAPHSPPTASLEPLADSAAEPATAPPAVPEADALIDALLADPDSMGKPPVIAPATLESVLATADASPAAPDYAAADESPLPREVQAASQVLSTSADVKALLADSSPPAGTSDGESALLIPLRLLSAPLTHADDSIRNAVGQIAIATLLNAIAVLVYVLVVRHK